MRSVQLDGTWLIGGVEMRGTDRKQSTMFSYVSPESRIPADHPLRATREMTNRALARLDGKFRSLYSQTGRPSIPPEQLLRALLLQVLYTVRSERMLMEELEYNLLFRWFVGLEMDDRVWDVTVFTKNRDRLLRGEIAEAFFQAVLEEAVGRGPPFGRALYSGWHADRSVGEPQELSTQGRRGGGPWRGPEGDGARLPR